MAHFRFEPMKELEYLSQRMKQFVEEFPDTFTVEVNRAFSPKVDIAGDMANIFVRVELPGVKKEDVKLVLKEKTLIVSGMKHAPAYPESAAVKSVESMHGDFQREIKLPDEVAQDTVSAKLEDGVLVVTLNRIQQTANEIHINVE